MSSQTNIHVLGSHFSNSKMTLFPVLFVHGAQASIRVPKMLHNTQRHFTRQDTNGAGYKQLSQLSSATTPKPR